MFQVKKLKKKKEQGVARRFLKSHCRSSFIAEGVRKATTPTTTIMMPHRMNEVVRPSPSAKKPMPTKPNIAGIRLTVKNMEKTLPSAEGSIFVWINPVNAEL